MPDKQHKTEQWPAVDHYEKKQSPIALEKKAAHRVDIPPINFENFGELWNIQIENNGDTVRIDIPEVCDCHKPKISGGGLVRNYVLENIHFHWPSEHVIDGKRYELEAHFMFYAEKHGTYENALQYPYGIAVMAVLYSDTTNCTESDHFRTIADAVKLISAKPSVTICNDCLNLHQFLPCNKRKFYHYRGSLTIPSYRENVHWIVFENASNISHLDLKDLTRIYDNKEELVKNNNRELQDVNDRTIFIRHML